MLNLRENEEVVKVVRQHRSVMAGAISWSVILAGFVSFTFIKFDMDAFGYSREIVIGIILIAALVILYKIYVWRKNTLIITSQRVIFDARRGAFSRSETLNSK